ncbi:MAG TPA: ATP cone domain-containing protein [Candidatus Paceibacterota bacterium]
MPDIVKADGTIEPFDPERLRQSLMRAGAGEYTARTITETVTRMVHRGMHSRDIYRRAFRLLRKETRPVAARYALRRALLDLGPSGHPFEDFVAHLFAKDGWQVEWRKILQGKCVPHEVDIYAHKDGATMVAELKYHNTPTYKTDVKVALYVKARLDDIWAHAEDRQTHPVERGFLITNTKFTSQAVDYARCAGIELIGWGHPLKGNLYERMYATRTYPITALTRPTKAEKRLLIDAGIVACDMLRERRETLAQLRFSPERIGAIIAEADALLALPHPYAYGEVQEEDERDHKEAGAIA